MFGYPLLVLVRFRVQIRVTVLFFRNGYDFSEQDVLKGVCSPARISFVGMELDELQDRRSYTIQMKRIRLFEFKKKTGTPQTILLFGKKK